MIPRIITIIGLAILIASCAMIGVVAETQADNRIEFGEHLITAIEKHQYVYDLADSIATCEGYYRTDYRTRAWRNKNPGNLKAYPPYDDKGHSIYPTHLEGWLDFYRILTSKYDGMTPRQMNVRYAEDKTWYKCVNKYLFIKQNAREKL